MRIRISVICVVVEQVGIEPTRDRIGSPPSRPSSAPALRRSPEGWTPKAPVEGTPTDEPRRAVCEPTFQGRDHTPSRQCQNGWPCCPSRSTAARLVHRLQNGRYAMKSSTSPVNSVDNSSERFADVDVNRGDLVLRKMLRTPPQPHKNKQEKPEAGTKPQPKD